MHDWRTTDEDEINRRKLRAQEESFGIINVDSSHSIFSNFSVQSGSGMTYSVEIRDLRERRFACTCVDFRANGLGTCKHVEAILLYLHRRFPRLYRSALKKGCGRPVIALDRKNLVLRLEGDGASRSSRLPRWFDSEGRLKKAHMSRMAALVHKWSVSDSGVWVSQEVMPWIDALQRTKEAARLRREYELKVQSGAWPTQETKVPLFPYQREGMLHLAFKERALLADEMGLGKTIQAIAACALLHRLGKADRVLVVAPASLKTEWEEQIARFTNLPCRLVFGPRRKRLEEYASPVFFTIVNYEQMLADSLDVNQRFRPDVVILDEAQRIKNWNTKTAQAVKRLRSRYAFVLTGTPIENRIDELHSLMDFLNPEVLGPLFRFNRAFYELDEKGRPEGYRDLDVLHERVKPFMIRRRKSDVESELPDRTVHNRLVPMSEGQWETYLDHKKTADRLLATARKRPLRKVELDILMREMASMRMICDSNYILDPEDRSCPKLEELRRILEDAVANDAKVIVFSEWERMLQLAREVCRELGLGFAWHTGSVPQKKRRGEINTFKSDPACRVFLSTDSGSTGLNLQNASVVVNCDLPWNPAKLEQRIARAWRKNQTRSVTVLNLVSENTIEHGMLETLASKQQLSDGVLDRLGDMKKVSLRGGRQVFLSKLEQMVSRKPEKKSPEPRHDVAPADRPLAFSEALQGKINGALVSCEERFPAEGEHSVVLVVVEELGRYQATIQDLHEEWFGGKLPEEEKTRLEVIDRGTAEALRRLESAGLYAPTFRASRALYPTPDTTHATPPPLSKEEQRRVQKCLGKAQRNLDMAKLLGNGGFESETRRPLIEAIHDLGMAMAIEHRFQEPADANQSLRPPIARFWAGRLEVLRGFVDSDQTAWRPITEALEPVCDSLAQSHSTTTTR